MYFSCHLFEKCECKYTAQRIFKFMPIIWMILLLVLCCQFNVSFPFLYKSFIFFSLIVPTVTRFLILMEFGKLFFNVLRFWSKSTPKVKCIKSGKLLTNASMF